MKKIKRFLIVFMLFVGVAFTTNGVFGFTLIHESKEVYKIEIVSANEYTMLYGSKENLFSEFKVSPTNDVYINGVLHSYEIATVNDDFINYFSNSPFGGFSLYYDYTLGNPYLSLSVGDIIEIVNYVDANDLVISTNFDFDSGYLQYSFFGDSGPYVNFPKFPSTDVSLRYDFVNQLQQSSDVYNSKSIVMYLPNQVISDLHDTVYRVGYVAYSYTAFNQSNVPIDIPSEVVAIRFVPDYSLLNSAPYFRMYMLDIYGDIVNVFNQVSNDYVELYPYTSDFVLNIGYSQFTESYYNGYEVGQSDGYGQGYNDGYLDGDYVGRRIGYDVGFADGFESTQYGGTWSILWQSVLAPFTLFETELFPGVTIGMLALIPIVFGLIGFLFSLGGRKK